MAAPRQRGFRARFAGQQLQSGQEQDFAVGLLSQFAQPLGMGSHAAGAGSFGSGMPGMGGAMGVSGTAGAMSMSGRGGMPGATDQ